MRGMDSKTGKAISGIEHLKQSIRDILTTRIGSRVMRRDYGSGVFDLIDAPMNRETILDIMAAAVDALLKWEPRIHPQRVQVTGATPGHLTLTITAIHVPDGRIITLDGIALAA